MNRFLQSVLSTESADVEEVEVVEEAQVDLESEQAAAEVVEAAHEVERNEIEQEELERVESSLEKMAMRLESAVASGKMSVESLGSYALAYDAVIGGALANPFTVESAEAEESEEGEESEAGEAGESEGEEEMSEDEVKDVAESSLESIKKTLKTIWEAIKKAVADSIAFISNFVKKLFDGAGRLDAQYENLEKKIAEAEKDKAVAADGDVKVPRAATLQRAGKLDAASLKDAISRINSELRVAADAQVDAATVNFTMLANFYKSQDDDVDALTQKLEEGTVKVIKLTATSQSGEIAGGKALQINDKTEDGKAPTMPSMSIVDVRNAPKYDGKGEMPVMSFAEIRTMIGSARALLKAIKDSKATREKLSAARKAAIDAGDGWFKSAQEGKLGDKVTETKARAALRIANSSIASNVALADRFTFTYVRALYGALAAHANHYGAKVTTAPEGSEQGDE